MYLSIDFRSFQIKYIFDQFSALSRIRHQQNMYRHNVLHAHGEDTVDPREERVRVLSEVLEISGHASIENFHFSIVHRFKKKLSIKRKEEE